jgi:hypothetical protein
MEHAVSERRLEAAVSRLARALCLCAILLSGCECCSHRATSAGPAHAAHCRMHLHRRPLLGPFNCFGYHATQWQSWPCPSEPVLLEEIELIDTPAGQSP